MAQLCDKFHSIIDRKLYLRSVTHPVNDVQVMLGLIFSRRSVAAPLDQDISL